MRLCIIVCLLLIIFQPGTIAPSAFTDLAVEQRNVDSPTTDSNSTGLTGINQQDSVQIGSSNQELVELTNNLDVAQQTEVDLENRYDWQIADPAGPVRSIAPDNSETYNADLSSVNTNDNRGSYTIISKEGSLTFEAERTVKFEQPTGNSLTLRPTTANQDSQHTWRIPDYTTPTDANGNRLEVDNITLQYTGTGADFDGLNNDDATVTLTRELSSGPDRSSININSDTYNGESATLRLSGVTTNNIIQDPNGNPNLVVRMNGITNPSTGSFTATLKLGLSDGSFKTFDQTFETNTDPFFEIQSFNAPSSVSGSDQFQVDYTVNNTGTGVGSQDVVFSVDSNEEKRERGVQLLEGSSFSDTFTFSDTTNRRLINVRVETNDDSRSQVIDIADRFSLTSDPNTGGVSEANHTWEASNLSFSGEVDTVTVDYPNGFSFNGLNQDDIVVKIQRQGDSTPTEINVNQDSYSGSTATFDLSGIFNTDVDGPVIIDINGIKNAPSGTYQPTITFEGSNDTQTITAEITTT